MSNETQNKSWLAAEYALGVTEGKAREEAEHLVERDASFRRSVDAWQNQLSPLLDDVEEVKPPTIVWKKIQQRINPVQVNNTTQSEGAGIWKLITSLSSTVAVACLGGLLYVSGGDFTSGTITNLKEKLEVSQSNTESATTAFQDIKSRADELEQQVAGLTADLSTAAANVENKNSELADAQSGLSQVQKQLSEAQTQLSAANTELLDARSQVASLRDQFNSSRPLVASLTQSGDAPAFVAQYDPIKKSLLIRTAVEDTDEKVPEIWLIPAQGDKKGEVLSLGVMDEKKPDEVKLSDDFIALIGEGGTLAITMEPPGGSPTGVATGPVIALGKLQSF